MRFIESDENLAMRKVPLKEAIENDIKLGLIPFWVSLTCLDTVAICIGLVIVARPHKIPANTKRSMTGEVL